MTNMFVIPEEEKRIITGRDELNICEWPLGQLRYDKGPLEGDYTAIFSDYIQGRNGQWIKREWTVKSYKDYGRPTPLTDDVVIALMEVAKETNDFQARSVSASKSMILQKLFRFKSEEEAYRLPGRCWNQLEEEMSKLVGIVIEAKNAFYQKEQDCYAKILKFHILEDFCFMEERRGRKSGQLVMPLGWFTWSQTFFNNLQIGYIKKLDTTLYYSLESALSRRLFRLLDKMSYKFSHYKIDLLILACEKLGMSRDYKKVADYKRKIEYTHSELIEKKIIESVEFVKEFSPFWNEDRWMIMYHFPKKEPKFTEQEADVLQMGVSEQEVILSRYDLSKEQRELVQWIMAQDPGQVAAEIAVEMIQKTPHCPEMVEVIVTDFENKKKKGFKFTNPIGWLRKTLSDPNYRRPKGLKTVSEKRREEQAKQESERKKHTEELLKKEYEQFVKGEIENYKASDPQRWERIWNEELDTAKRKNSFVADTLRKDPKAIEKKSVRDIVDVACKKVVVQALSLPAFEEWLKNR